MSFAIRLFIKITLWGGGGEFMNGSTFCENQVYEWDIFVYDSGLGLV